MGDGYYRWFPGDFMRDTADLSLAEDGAYRRLLDHYYSEEQLPSDKERTYRICRASSVEEQKAVDFVTGRFFATEGDRLINARAEKELGERRKFVEEQTRKSHLGHKARWGKKMPGGMPAATPGACPDDAQPSPSPLRSKPLSDTSASVPSFGRGNGKDQQELQAFFDAWNKEATSLSKAREFNDSRKKKIKARLRERPLEEWRRIFRRMNASPFLRGESGNGTFRADLDWIIKNQENAVKVSEGRYDRQERLPLASIIRDAAGNVL